jgi:DNA polymerase-3 subunit chi
MLKTCNFYILPNARQDGRFLFCCALIEKLYAHGHKVYVHCQQAHEAAHFNDLLWTYKEESFIPHGLMEEYPIEDCPVQIGFNSPTPTFQDVLLFLTPTPQVPEFYQQFSRIIEIVDAEPGTKETLREHYQFYRSQNIEVKTHQI